MPKPGPRTTYKYSDHFKATAVRLSHLPGVAISAGAYTDRFYIRSIIDSLAD